MICLERPGGDGVVEGEREGEGTKKVVEEEEEEEEGVGGDREGFEFLLGTRPGGLKGGD